ncbi:hypothetical protein E2C01_079214 [Portunus trituberculatus]|uniref:Uncharacterized protein n=1 Tax=Portunus trituberculatus TaxID=210409 RepID=A0A5B7IPQ4_PORTR|nr:hypothetical protein [Portunus trituberculatus]
MRATRTGSSAGQRQLLVGTETTTTRTKLGRLKYPHPCASGPIIIALSTCVATTSGPHFLSLAEIPTHSMK